MPQTVHLFVLDTLADWEPGFAISNINDPGFQKVPGRYQVRTVGPTTNPITTKGGVRIQPDMSLDQLRASDSAMLILPGADTWDQGQNGEAVEKARAFLAAAFQWRQYAAPPPGLPAEGFSTRASTPATPPGTSPRQDTPAVTSIATRMR